MVPGLSDRMLAERMRELQAAQLVEREVVPTTPVQIRYHLTERGTELIRALQPLVKWGHRWQHPGEGAQADVTAAGGGTAVPGRTRAS